MAGDGAGVSGALLLRRPRRATRVLAVADVVEAMSSYRPYRPALGMEVALEEIRAGAATQYDPDVAVACERLIVEKGFAFTP